jgi:hypothetical protein
LLPLLKEFVNSNYNLINEANAKKAEDRNNWLR